MGRVRRGHQRPDRQLAAQHHADDGLLGRRSRVVLERALQGEFFEHDQTLHEYRAILSIGDIIWLLPTPLGASAFAKGGSIDVPGFHAVCGAGGMTFDDTWVYFCFTINWEAAAQQDPATVVAWAAAASRALQLVKDALAA